MAALTPLTTRLREGGDAGGFKDMQVPPGCGNAWRVLYAERVLGITTAHACSPHCGVQRTRVKLPLRQPGRSHWKSVKHWPMNSWSHLRGRKPPGLGKGARILWKTRLISLCAAHRRGREDGRVPQQSRRWTIWSTKTRKSVAQRWSTTSDAEQWGVAAWERVKGYICVVLSVTRTRR